MNQRSATLSADLSPDQLFPPEFAEFRKRLHQLYIEQQNRNLKRKEAGIPLSSFPTLYKKYYGEDMDLRFYGCKRLKDLIEKKCSDPEKPTVALVSLLIQPETKKLENAKTQKFQLYQSAIVEILENLGHPISGQALYQKLKKKFIGFNTKSLGFKKFKPFVQALIDKFNRIEMFQEGYVLYFKLAPNQISPQVRNRVEILSESILQEEEEQKQIDQYKESSMRNFLELSAKDHQMIEQNVPNFLEQDSSIVNPSNREILPSNEDLPYLNIRAPVFESSQPNLTPQQENERLMTLVQVLRMRVDDLEQQLQQERIEKAELKNTIKLLESNLRIEELKNQRNNDDYLQYNPIDENNIWSTENSHNSGEKKRSYLGQAVRFNKK